MKNKGNLLHLSDLEFKQYQQQNPQVTVSQVIPLGPSVPPSHNNKKGHSKKTEYAGYVFDSKLEADRYAVLRRWQHAGLIKNLSTQHDDKAKHTWVLQPKTGKQRAITWTDDFQYVQTSTGLLIIEDVKGFLRPVSRLRHKMLQFKYPDINFFLNYELNGWYIPEGVK